MAYSIQVESDEQPQLRSALERVLPEASRIANSSLLPMNVDPLNAAATVRAALPKLKALRAKLERELPRFPQSNIDNLEPYALALIQSHSLVLCAKAPPPELSEVVVEAKRLRRLLYSDVMALAQRGIVNIQRVKVTQGKPTHQSIARDLLTLTNVLRSNWKAISGNCAVAGHELDQAEALGTRLLQLLGARDRTPILVARATLDRQRIYTLLARAYDQVRKAVTYLRWERGDIEKIVPSLYGGRNVARRKATPKIDVPVLPPSPVVQAEPVPVSSIDAPAVTDPFLH